METTESSIRVLEIEEPRNKSKFEESAAQSSIFISPNSSFFSPQEGEQKSTDLQNERGRERGKQAPPVISEKEKKGEEGGGENNL